MKKLFVLILFMCIDMAWAQDLLFMKNERALSDPYNGQIKRVRTDQGDRKPQSYEDLKKNEKELRQYIGYLFQNKKNLRQKAIQQKK